MLESKVKIVGCPSAIHAASTSTVLRSSATNTLEQKQRELLKALNGTSQSARTSWFFFLTFMAYLFVAVASVAHTDLLLNEPIRLPILQIDMPLAVFFLVSPVLFVLVHFGVLLHHAMLSQKAFALDDLLRRDETKKPRSHYLRLEVSSYFFSQREAGPKRSIVTKMLLGSMTFLTLNLLPLLLLLYFQASYLPVHDSVATWCHRLYVCADLIVLLLVGIGRRWSGESLFRRFRSSFRLSGSALLNFVTWPTILFSSICVATLPAAASSMEQTIARFMIALWPARVPFDVANQNCRERDGNGCAFWLTAFIFEQPIDYVSGRRPWFSRNLVVTDKESLFSNRHANPPEARISLRGRDLRYATFDRSNLQLVDLTAADLSGASLKGADLSEVTLGCAVSDRFSAPCCRWAGLQYAIRHEESGSQHDCGCC